MVKIGIIGVNGLVGRAVLESIKILNLFGDNYEYYLYGSVDAISYTGIIEKFRLDHLEGLDYAILAVDNIVARAVHAYIFEKNLNITVIDNSSEFRLYQNVPLCIPEINLHTLANLGSTRFISNPNCVTTLMCMVLKPLLNLADITRIVASTYQAASGAGYRGLEELKLQTKEINDEMLMAAGMTTELTTGMTTGMTTGLTTTFWKKQYVYNIFSHNSKITDSLYNEEEMKLINETQKILDIKCKITPTCIRVPTLRSHCISLNVEFCKDLKKDDVCEELKKFPGLIILDNISTNEFPEPIVTSRKTDVYVGRIRPDIDNNKCWNFFISGDQLLKGAGYNSVQILKALL